MSDWQEVYKDIDPNLYQVLSACSVSTKMFASTFYEERFYAEFSPAIHDPIFELIDSPYRHVGIAAPRGTGKTSIVGLALPSRKILFGQSHFLVYISKSFKNAELQTENLKNELVTNRAIRSLFGDIRTAPVDMDSGLDESFAKDAWVANTPAGQCLVLPRGSGQQVRGLIYKNFRPDLIIIDDLEDTGTIDNEEIRKDRKRWLYGDVLKTPARMSKNFQFIYIDTLKHFDALLQAILDSGMWKTVRLELCDDGLRSNAPSFISDDEIREEYEFYKEEGLLDVFAQENRNQPISKEDMAFKQEYFQKYREDELLTQGVQLESFVLCDPAKTIKDRSADSAVVCVGVDYIKNRIYVRGVERGKFRPDELYDKIFEMAIYFRCHAIGVEVTSLNEFITQPLENEMKLRGLYFELVELKPRGGGAGSGKGSIQSKIARIGAMGPDYRAGRVFHNPLVCAPLEMQLLSYPKSKKWDVMDCMAYYIEMLELGDRWMEPPEDEEEDMDDREEQELAALYDMDDEPLEGWRLV